MEISEYKQQLLQGTRYDTEKLNTDVVPKQKGLYAWFTKNEDKLVYIGKATGKSGLYRRIVYQHLNPAYLEIREANHRSKDNFQLQNATYKNGKIGIDKSAFRKNVARKKQLRAGNESVDYLKTTFNVSFIVLGDLSNVEIYLL